MGFGESSDMLAVGSSARPNALWRALFPQPYFKCTGLVPIHVTHGRLVGVAAYGAAAVRVLSAALAE